MYVLRPREKTSTKTVMYLSGGGFILPISPLHWAFIDNIIESTNVNVVVPLYPLAPKHTIDDVIDYLLNIYENFIGIKEELTIMGDSAGATIALALIQVLKKQNLEFPKQVIGISPLVDFELKNPKIHEIQKRDPITATPALKEIGKWVAVTEPYLMPCLVL